MPKELMTTFFVRAELPESSNYHVFHAAMERRGFSKTIYESGTIKDLPTGSYLLDTHKGIYDVVLEVLKASEEVTGLPKIVVSGNNQIVTSGLENHNALLGALAAYLTKQRASSF